MAMKTIDILDLGICGLLAPFKSFSQPVILRVADIKGLHAGPASLHCRWPKYLRASLWRQRLWQERHCGKQVKNFHAQFKACISSVAQALLQGATLSGCTCKAFNRKALFRATSSEPSGTPRMATALSTRPFPS